MVLLLFGALVTDPWDDQAVLGFRDIAKCSIYGGYNGEEAARVSAFL
jgi:hypothetical protein